MERHDGKVEDFAEGQEMRDAWWWRNKINLTDMWGCSGRKQHYPTESQQGHSSQDGGRIYRRQRGMWRAP